MKDIMINTVTNAVKMYGSFFGAGLYVNLFLIALFYIFVFEREKSRQKLFLGHTILFAVLYLFPVTAYIIMTYCVGVTVYWRMFWLLPITVLIAYVLTQVTFYSEKRVKRVLVAAILFCLIYTQGNSLYVSNNFTKAPNPYKINQDVLGVCDVIEEDAQKNGMDTPGVIVTNDLSIGIRQYDANILMPYSRDAMWGDRLSNTSQKIYNLMNAENLDVSALAYYAALGNYEYLVYPIGQKADEIVAAGFTLVKDVGNYDVYRLNVDAVPNSSWLVTEYGSTDKQMLFYTLQDKVGHLIVVDGGWVDNADNVREVIGNLGNHVDAWILTHPHEDHIGAFCEVYDDPGKITIDHVYAVDMASPELCMENAPWDSVSMYQRFLSMDIPQLQYMHAGDEMTIGDLRLDVLSAYDDQVDQLSDDLLNDGSMMFQAHGSTQTMLFCADVGKSMSEYLTDKYGDSLKSDYIQMGHHGNGGLESSFYTIVTPKVSFFDAPDWLFNDTTGTYTTPANRQLMESLGSRIVSFSIAPNSIILK